MNTKDKIAIATRNGIRAYYNMNESMVKGIEFDVKHRLSRDWRVYLNYTFESGEYTSGGDTYRDWDLPKHMAGFGIDYTRGKFGGVLDARYVAARQDVDTTTGEYGSEDSFFTTNLYLTYKFDDSFRLQFGIDNLFNRHFYANEAASDRTYSLGAMYSF